MNPALRSITTEIAHAKEAQGDGGSAASPRSAQTTHEAEAQVYPWYVIHACECVRDVFDVVEGQLAVGMRPYLLTPRGGGNASHYLQERRSESEEPASLLTAWNHVRNWRRSLAESDAQSAAEIVHAHSFASGMAAVRALPNTVYDLHTFVELLAVAAGHCDERSWLARSFRVAEQFILSRAASVIVHADSLRTPVIERGASAESVFCIPQPVASAWLETQPQFDGAAERVNFFAPDVGVTTSSPEQDHITAAVNLLTAFQLALGEAPEITLTVVPEEANRSLIMQTVQNLGIAASVRVESDGTTERDVMTRSCDVVIAGASGRDEAKLIYRAHLPNRSMLRAMSAGRAVLAADSVANRNVSADGRGCVWYGAAEASPREMATRIAFLARNVDFRSALGRAARAHVEQTRSMRAVGAQYDRAYQHAHLKRRDRGTATPLSLPLHPAFGRF